MIELEELYGDRHRYEEHCDHDYPVDRPVCCECHSTSVYREYYKLGKDIICDECMEGILRDIIYSDNWVSDLAEFMGVERVFFND